VRPPSLRGVIACTIRNWIADNASTTGAALAFYCAFSLAPLLIIILAVAGWIVGEASATGFLQSQLNLLFGSSTAKVVLEAMRNSQQSEGVLATVVSIGTLLIGATTVLAALDEALETILGGIPREGSGLFIWVHPRPELPAAGLADRLDDDRGATILDHGVLQATAGHRGHR
jgi:membrane protein